MGQMDNEELRDAMIAELARKHAAALRTNVLAGHEQTLHDLCNAVGDRLSNDAVLSMIIRSAFACGPLTAGNLITDLVQRCMDDDAEIEAIKEVERMEADLPRGPQTLGQIARRQSEVFQAAL